MDIGEDLRIKTHMDAHATIGLSNRAGLGKARYIETAGVGIQGTLERQAIVLVKLRT